MTDLSSAELCERLTAANVKLAEANAANEARMLESKMIEHILDDEEGWRDCVPQQRCPTMQSAIELRLSFEASRKELSEATKWVEELEARVLYVEDERNARYNQNEDVLQQLASRDEEISDLRRDLGRINGENGILRLELGNINSSVRALSAENKLNSDLLESSNGSMAQLIVERDAIRQRNADLESEVTRLTASMSLDEAKAIAENMELGADVARLRERSGRVETLKLQCDALEIDRNYMRTQITETLDDIPGEGEVRVTRKTRMRRECETCGEPAHFKITYLLANARNNPASSAYRHDDCSWCEDECRYFCKEHQQDRNSPDECSLCAIFPATPKFAHMFLYWHESK